MKILTLLLLGIGISHLQAQTTAPKGFQQGAVILEDSTVLHGFLKDEIRQHATVTFLHGKDGKRQELSGWDIKEVDIDSNSYICVKGDFFKVLAKGKVCLLQKCSDASGKPIYNGTEAIMVQGTAGGKGDYFIYEPARSLLQLVNRRTYESVVQSTFSGCTAAIEKTKAGAGDMNGLREAVEVYDKQNL